MINLQSLEAPAHWACALINGDYSGLSTEECQHVAHWRRSNNVRAVLSLESEEPRWTRHMHLYDTMGEAVAGHVHQFACDVAKGA